MVASGKRRSTSERNFAIDIFGTSPFEHFVLRFRAGGRVGKAVFGQPAARGFGLQADFNCGQQGRGFHGKLGQAGFDFRGRVELVDVLDERGNQVGKLSRSQRDSRAVDRADGRVLCGFGVLLFFFLFGSSN